MLSYKWFHESKVIASFLSIKSEISTLSLNNFINDQGKILCLPTILKKNKGSLEFKSYREEDDLIIGEYDIQEPKNNKILLPDIIIVPCLGFDREGFRLGYGGGYYDKTISSFFSFGHSFLTVGLAYDDQKVEKIVRGSYDQKLNYILTEKQLYESL